MTESGKGYSSIVSIFEFFFVVGSTWVRLIFEFIIHIVCTPHKHTQITRIIANKIRAPSTSKERTKESFPVHTISMYYVEFIPSIFV